MQYIINICNYIIYAIYKFTHNVQESRAAARKPRDAASVLFR